jgi:hypothetical protein
MKEEEASSSSTEYRPLSSSKLTAVPVRPLSSGFATSPLMTTRLPSSGVSCFLFRISVATAACPLVLCIELVHLVYVVVSVFSLDDCGV